MCPHHAGTFVGAHLEVYSGSIRWFLHAYIGIIEMAPGSIGGHALLAGKFVGAHL